MISWKWLFFANQRPQAPLEKIVAMAGWDDDRKERGGHGGILSHPGRRTGFRLPIPPRQQTQPLEQPISERADDRLEPLDGVAPRAVPLVDLEAGNQMDRVGVAIPGRVKQRRLEIDQKGRAGSEPLAQPMGHQQRVLGESNERRVVP